MSTLIESVFIGTRTAGNRYGPQSRDMKVSELITLLSTENKPTQYVMPDFSGYARCLDEQIRAHFVQKEQDDYYRRYRLLSEIWYQAGSISNPENRSRRFEKVMEESQSFLVHTQDVMPKINPFTHDWEVWPTIAEKGKMYCLALLFHIIARAAFDPGSTAADGTLLRHCQWMKNWIKNVLNEYFLNEMMVSMAMINHERFPALRILGGHLDTRDIDTVIAQQLRKLDKEQNEKRVHEEFGSLEVTLKYRHFKKEQYDLIDILGDLHFRIDRLEMLLQELAENHEIDFNKADEAGEWIDAQMKKIESKEDVKQLPAGL
jgi:hypothetical protein